MEATQVLTTINNITDDIPHQPDITDNLPSSLHAVQLKNLLLNYQGIFAQHEDNHGYTTLVEHEIHTQEEEQQVQLMLAQGIIHPSSNLGGTRHFCMDYHRLSKVIIKDAQPLPWIKDILESLHDACWFSRLDLNSRYWQKPFKEEHKHLAFHAS